jgi:hypothetical protein
MNESNLENYRSAWRQEQSFGTRSLGRDEINSVLKKESKSMVQQFRTGLVLDMVIKGLLALALAGVLFLVPASAKLSSLNAAVLALTLFLIFLQSITLHQVPRPSVIGDNLRNYLREITWFYRKRFVGALYVAAVSGSLVFYVGALYYGRWTGRTTWFLVSASRSPSRSTPPPSCGSTVFICVNWKPASTKSIWKAWRNTRSGSGASGGRRSI